MIKKGHDRLKYGDIVNIEFSDESEPGQISKNTKEILRKKQYMLTAVGFSFNENGKIDITLCNSSFQNDYEKNLFIIFPPMNDGYLTNSTTLEEKIGTFSAKIDQQIYFDSNKDDLNKIISAYNETKKDINNSDFLDVIGQSIKFLDKFILIHYQSQTLLSVHEFQNTTHAEFDNRLALCDHYNENCIFVFDAYNKYDNSADEVFSGQSIYIRKKEKHAWANNPYLYQKNITKQLSNLEIISGSEDIPKKSSAWLQQHPSNKKGQLTIEDEEDEIATDLKRKAFSAQKSRKFMDKIISYQRIYLTDDKETATSFKVKVCSSYIDPASTNLSFTNTIWIVCLSQEKYLLVKEAPKSEIKPESHNDQCENRITYAQIEGDKQIHNIYGLFDVEQLETHPEYILSDKIDSSFIHYNRIVRLRNVATKQYLGFDDYFNYDQKIQEIFDNDEEELEFRNFSNKVNIGKQKKVGKLVLTDEPNSMCEWTFMESYIILNRELYEKSKLEGITAKKKNNDNEIVDNFVKKKDILRIFHVKSGKFLSFEDIDKNTNDKFSFITLSKQPVDNDLFQLSPSNESQAYEIYLILFFSENFNRLLSEVMMQDLISFLKKGKKNLSLHKGESMYDGASNKDKIKRHRNSDNIAVSYAPAGHRDTYDFNSGNLAMIKEEGPNQFEVPKSSDASKGVPKAPDFAKGNSFVGIPKVPDFHKGNSQITVPKPPEFHKGNSQITVPKAPDFQKGMSQSMTPNLGWTGSFPGFSNLSREPSTVIPTNFNTFDKTETKQKDNKSDIKEKREREEKERKDKERKDKEDKDKWEKEEKKERLDKIRKFTQDWKDLRHCFEDISVFQNRPSANIYKHPTLLLLFHFF